MEEIIHYGPEKLGKLNFYFIIAAKLVQVHFLPRIESRCFLRDYLVW